MTKSKNDGTEGMRDLIPNVASLNLFSALFQTMIVSAHI